MYTLSQGLKSALDKRKKTTEDTIETYLVKCVEAIGGHAVKIRLVTGFPDRMVLLPGVVLFVELKRPVGGRFEPLQPVWIKRLKKLRIPIHVIRTKAEVDKLLEQYADS